MIQFFMDLSGVLAGLFGVLGGLLLVAEGIGTRNADPYFLNMFVGGGLLGLSLVFSFIRRAQMREEREWSLKNKKSKVA